MSKKHKKRTTPEMTPKQTKRITGGTVSDPAAVAFGATKSKGSVTTYSSKPGGGWTAT